MKQIYLDLCALKRPFDDQTQPRIWLETQAMSLIFQAVESLRVELVCSTVLFYENEQNNWMLRRDAVKLWIKWAAATQNVTNTVEDRAEEIQKMGIKTIDALHLSCAESIGVEDFITCDDDIKKKYTGPLRVSLPTEFVLNNLPE